MNMYTIQVFVYNEQQPKSQFEQLYNDEKEINAHLIEEINGLKKIIAQVTHGSSSRRESRVSYVISGAHS